MRVDQAGNTKTQWLILISLEVGPPDTTDLLLWYTLGSTQPMKGTEPESNKAARSDHWFFKKLGDRRND